MRRTPSSGGVFEVRGAALRAAGNAALPATNSLREVFMMSKRDGIAFWADFQCGSEPAYF